MTGARLPPIEMPFTLSLTHFAMRLLVLGLMLAVSVGLFRAVRRQYVISTLSDGRYRISADGLQAAVAAYPQSDRLHYRLAREELQAEERNLDLAEQAAQKAIQLSKYRFDYYAVLATAQEAKGDRAAAEGALREAVRLSPNDMEMHWRLANLLLRQGKINESVGEFQQTIALNPTLLPASLDVVWRVSGGEVQAVRAITGEGQRPRAILAEFLVGKARLDEAAETIKGLDKTARLEFPETATVIGRLMQGGRLDLAWELWSEMVGHSAMPMVWNGSFENDFLKSFDLFDWKIRRSEYARIGLDPRLGHSSSRSLVIEFLGRDTTILQGEIQQLTVVPAGRRYRLEGYARTANFISPSGPRLAVLDSAGRLLGRSEPVATGTDDWQLLTVDFVVPPLEKATVAAITITIQRKPEASYDDPTKGVVWFDDFKLVEHP